MIQKPLISFDYAIKYLLKDKGDYSIVEGFISALLKTRGYKDVKIIALLEPESNKEDSKNKRSLADVIVEDEDRNKYIIEIERNFKESFVHKACFNTARLIVDNLAQRQDYTQIVKVFHISLLYFSVGRGVVYHGQNIIHEIETKEKLCVHLTNETTGQIFDATNILPEYFFISIPSFSDRLEQDLDEWLYVMKHDDTPTNFHSPYMRQVEEKLNILKMTADERNQYSYYQKALYNDRDELAAAIKKGRSEGVAEGESKKAIEIAKKMLELGMDIKTIEAATSLSTSEIESLKNF